MIHLRLLDDFKICSETKGFMQSVSKLCSGVSGKVAVALGLEEFVVS